MGVLFQLGEKLMVLQLGNQERMEIGVKYATNRVGKFTKTITLSTNADKRPVILTIKGEVKAPPKDEGAMPVKKNTGSPLERN